MDRAGVEVKAGFLLVLLQTGGGSHRNLLFGRQFRRRALRLGEQQADPSAAFRKMRRTGREAMISVGEADMLILLSAAGRSHAIIGYAPVGSVR